MNEDFFKDWKQDDACDVWIHDFNFLSKNGSELVFSDEGGKEHIFTLGVDIELEHLRNRDLELRRKNEQ